MRQRIVECGLLTGTRSPEGIMKPPQRSLTGLLCNAKAEIMRDVQLRLKRNRKFQPMIIVKDLRLAFMKWFCIQHHYAIKPYGYVRWS